MNKRRVSILLALVMAMSVLVMACTKKEVKEEPKVEEKKTEELVEKRELEFVEVKDLDSNIQIIDIRHPDLFLGWANKDGNRGHIANAVDFPVSWLEYEKNKEFIDIELERRYIDKDRKTVIYSDSDIDEEIFNLYGELGFKELYSLKGGFNEYIKEGKDIEFLKGYEMYVGTQWVEDLVNGKSPEGYKNDDYRIVEIAFNEDEYGEGHIKNAITLHPDVLNQIPGPRNLADYESIPIEDQLEYWGFPKDEDIQKVLEEAGITKNTTVVLYANEKATTAINRAALVMEYAGVEDIRLLNGGRTLWELEGRELTKEVPEVEKVEFGVKVPAKPEVVYTYEQEMDFINDDKAVIASVRSWDEYIGKISGYTYIGETGDIEKSRFAYAGSDPYAMEDFRNLDNTMFNYNIVNERWKKWGITGDKLVSFHCGTGWRAAETYYIAKALGWKNTGVYVGGWYEWHKRDNSPVMEEGLPIDAPEESPEQYFYKLDK